MSSKQNMSPKELQNVDLQPDNKSKFASGESLPDDKDDQQTANDKSSKKQSKQDISEEKEDVQPLHVET